MTAIGSSQYICFFDVAGDDFAGFWGLGGW